MNKILVPVNNIPEQFLYGSALLNAASEELMQSKGYVCLDDILSILIARLELEPNPILADIYRQTIEYILKDK